MHDNALGVSIPDENIEEFISKTNMQLANENFDVSYSVDLIYDANFIDYNDLYSIAEADHLWGKDIEEPLIVIQKIILNQDNISLLKGTTLKIILNDGISLIKFGSSEEEFNQLMPQSLYATNTIEVVGTCQINSWDNKPQILIQDYNITTQNAYYF